MDDALQLERCELLQNVYLCSSKHNSLCEDIPLVPVVNCFKMCIFAVASTMFRYFYLIGVWL